MVRTVALIFSSGTRLKRVSSHTCTPYPLELSVAVGAAVPGAHPPKAHPGSVGLAALDLRICPKVSFNTCTVVSTGPKQASCLEVYMTLRWVYTQYILP